MNPIVTFEMENGKTFKAELYPDKAPNTVNNFLSLVQKGYYDGLEQGKKNLARELSHIIDKHLVITLKDGKQNNKVSIKALEKFWMLLGEEEDHGESGS